MPEKNLNSSKHCLKLSTIQISKVTVWRDNNSLSFKPGGDWEFYASISEDITVLSSELYLATIKFPFILNGYESSLGECCHGGKIWKTTVTTEEIQWKGKLNPTQLFSS